MFSSFFGLHLLLALFLSLSVNAQTCETIGTQSNNQWSKDIQTAIWAVRQSLCGGSFDGHNCNTLDSTGAINSNCFAQDSNIKNIQGYMTGNSPTGQVCWDAFQAIINNCILSANVKGADTWRKGGVYTYSGNTYYLTIRAGQSS